MPSNVSLFLYGGTTLVFFIFLLAVWVWVGPGPRRSRRLGKAQRLIQEGNWEEAFPIIRNFLQQNPKPGRWQKRLHQVAGDCFMAAGRQCLKDKDFEQAAENLEKASSFHQRSQEEARLAVINAMLEEIRRLFSESERGNTQEIHQLISRTLLLKSPCNEAYFWQALCFIRDGKNDQAIDILKALTTGNPVGRDITEVSTSEVSTEKVIDPPLYLGALLLRNGDTKEGLRFLTEANRIDGNCPFVICNLGKAMIDSGGNTQIAVRALQKPLGPQGFAIWEGRQQQAWVEGFPENLSYVHRLASRHKYTCPLWGSDFKLLVREGQTALAQGYYLLHQYDHSVGLFDKLSQTGAPSLKVLRGLGMSLVKQGKFDQAFKHLRAAYELESPKNYLTAGYLGLCAAVGKPAQPEDKINNVTWALHLVQDFSSLGDTEFVSLLNRIHLEARECNLEIDRAIQTHLCDHLLSVMASDRLSASAIYFFYTTYPEDLRPQYSWLYGRAAQKHDLRDEYTLSILTRIFQEPEPAREFFAAQDWDFSDLEFTYLKLTAEKEPGRFPGLLPAEKGEKLLLEKAAGREQAGDRDAAIAALEVLIRLSPQNPGGYDQLAHYYFQGDQLDKAVEYLEVWHHFDPSNSVPLTRLAILENKRGNAEASKKFLQLALDNSQGLRRSEIAFLGARLALSSHSLATCEQLLLVCLRENPNHALANWCLAGLSVLKGDFNSLGSQAEKLQDPEETDPRYHLMAAVAYLASGNHAKMEEACDRIAPDAAIKKETYYLKGWSALDQEDINTAEQYFTQVTAGSQSPSGDHAKALLGGIHFLHKSFDQAVECWNSLKPETRKKWDENNSLARTVYLNALRKFKNEDYQKAAILFREAGKLGVREEQLGSLLSLSLLKAGQKIFYHPESI